MKMLIWLFFIAFPFCSFAQDVLKLSDSLHQGTGTLSQLKWLTGNWIGTGLGGDCEELWMPANDSSMHGIFRFSKKGTLQFTEYMVIEERNGSLKVRLKHFGRNLQPWEEKETWTEFKLVKLEGQTAWFSGLTYQRKGDELIIKLALKSKEGSSIEEFRFRKSTL